MYMCPDMWSRCDAKFISISYSVFLLFKFGCKHFYFDCWFYGKFNHFELYSAILIVGFMANSTTLGYILQKHMIFTCALLVHSLGKNITIFCIIRTSMHLAIIQLLIVNISGLGLGLAVGVRVRVRG